MTPPAAARAQAAPPLAPRRRVGAPPRPRRISGPVQPRTQSPAAAPARAAQGGVALGLIGLVGKLDALASHRLLDRLIRSRVWIGIIAFALIGIVTLQLGLLKLNSGIGRALEREGALQRDNAALSVENSELAAGSRVESQAQQLGMRLASVAGLKFLSSHARTDVPNAAAALQSAGAHEAAAPVAESSPAGEGREAGAAPAEAGGESTAGESGGSESESSGGSEAVSEAPAPSAGGGEEARTSEAGSEAGGEPVPAGEGGGAAAPGG